MSESAEGKTPPKLVQRRANRSSSFRSGRTIGEKRERLETANERAAARKKDKLKKASRILLTIIGFLFLTVVLVAIVFTFFGSGGEPSRTSSPEEKISYDPTIEIIDEDSGSGSKITSRMRTYIGQAEQDFRDLGYSPTKVVIPSNTIREVDFYLDGYTGYIKLLIDRDTAVSVEDADRMIHYLSEQGIDEFQYIDVRIEGKAYWK